MMLTPQNAKANAILAILLANDSELFDKYSVGPFVNGREEGYLLRHIFEDRAAAFCESRNTDSIVIYHGRSMDFDITTNLVKEDDVWNNCKRFHYYEYYESAMFIKKWLKGE